MMDLRPSASHAWVNCAASPLFRSKVPREPDSDATMEGTCAAWLAEVVLNGEVSDIQTMLGESHPVNHWIITQDMVDHISNYCQFMQSRGGTISAELYVRLNEYIAGTLDCSTSNLGDTLFIDDLKYGYLIVNEFRNFQTLIYGIGTVMSMVVKPKWISMGIYQPRASHPQGIYRTWVISIEELGQWAEFIFYRGAMCQQPNPVATPGDHCLYCEASASCDALASSSYKLASVVESQHQVPLTQQTIATELDFLDRAERLIKARRTGVVAQAEQMIQKGAHIKGWHLNTGLGNRKFTVAPDIIKAITGVDPFKQEVMTPIEVERAGGNAKHVKNAVAQLTSRPTTGYKLTRMAANHFDKLFPTTKA